MGLQSQFKQSVRTLHFIWYKNREACKLYDGQLSLEKDDNQPAFCQVPQSNPTVIWRRKQLKTFWVRMEANQAKKYKVYGVLYMYYTEFHNNHHPLEIVVVIRWP